MRIWFDTEFLEDGRTIELISIGAVREDGAELYLETTRACYLAASSEWLLENVLPGLRKDAIARRTPPEMRYELRAFVGENPEFWAYYADYDWVVLCQLFGRMIDLPKGWPMYCRDLKQEADRRGLRLPPFRDGRPAHNALADALECRDRHLWLEAQP